MKNDIPSKLYYSISEVARITGIKAHVLRYWETEFPTLRVKKSRTGSRRYRRPDIDEILAIKELLYEQGFKIAGARKVRRQTKHAVQETGEVRATQMTMGFGDMEPSEQLSFVGKELRSLQQMLLDMKIPAIGGKAPRKVSKTTKKMKGTA